ncbi:hypothetical protein APED_32020 [Acanthopleuribacter pedis]
MDSTSTEKSAFKQKEQNRRQAGLPNNATQAG